MQNKRGTVHIRCGTDIRDSLALAKIDGDFIEWSDPVCQGPVPANVSTYEMCCLRARFICDHYLDQGQYEMVLAKLEAEQRIFDQLDDYEKIFLWFEHDFFDQSILLRLLSELAQRPALHERIWLLSIDHFSGIQRFIGFGQLRPEMLQSLLGQECQLSSEAYRFAHRTWQAFRSEDPRNLELIMNETLVPDLPFLKSALRRYFQEFPDLDHGLGLSYRLALEAVNSGLHSAVQVFHDLISHRDPQPFLGDSMFFSLLKDLIDARVPALHDRNSDLEALELTDFGRTLLEGTGDWIAENGEDRDETKKQGSSRVSPRWLGGVRVSVSDFPWRWNERLGQLVRVDNNVEP